MEWNSNSLVLREAESTNDTLMHLAKTDRALPQLYSVVANYQTAGRGQRGNSWKVSPNRSLTFSILLRSGSIAPQEQYAVSEFIAVGTAKVLRSLLTEEQAQHLKIKWPNDIYYRDRKLVGILIEHSITGGRIDFSVAGLGINVNETAFADDLPNPISLWQITGEKHSIQGLHTLLVEQFASQLEAFLLGNYSGIHTEYMRVLYRRKGLHRYYDVKGVFLAEIKDVLPSGHLVLCTEQGEDRVYAFKEVTFDVD